MLYYFFTWLNEHYNVSGARLFEYNSFRTAMAVLFSLLIATIYGRRVINLLRKNQIGETVRDLGLQGEQQKKGTPTMGGIIILLSIIIPTLLFADLEKTYIRLMLLCTAWLGFIGFLDDYFKLKARRRALAEGKFYSKKDRDGLAGITKIIGQVGLGIIIGTTLYFSNNVVVEREIIGSQTTKPVLLPGEKRAKGSNIIIRNINGTERSFAEVKTPITTIPFVKSH